MNYHAHADSEPDVPARDARDSGRRRRGLALLTSLVALVAVGCSQPSSRPGASPSGSGSPAIGGERAGTGRQSGVVGGALFGGDIPLTPETARIGRNLAIVRTYYRLGQQFPTAQSRSLMKAGSTLLVSLDTVPGRGEGSYASIIAGQHDAAIRQFLENMQRAAVTYHLGAIYFCFEHEANAPKHLVLGGPAQFVRAWDHIRALAASAHLLWNDGGRLRFVLILTHLAYYSPTARPRWAANVGRARSFFPGRNEVDIVGADGYNSGDCHTATLGPDRYVASGSRTVTPRQLFGPVIDFARSAGGLPVFIPEWGTVAYAGSAEQVTFIRQMRTFVSANPEIAAALYWNSQGQGQNVSCDYSLNSHPPSLSALAEMGHSRALQGHVMPPG